MQSQLFLSTARSTLVYQCVSIYVSLTAAAGLVPVNELHMIFFFLLVCLKKQLPVVRETVAVRGGFTGSQFERVPFILLFFFLPR